MFQILNKYRNIKRREYDFFKLSIIPHPELLVIKMSRGEINMRSPTLFLATSQNPKPGSSCLSVSKKRGGLHTLWVLMSTSLGEAGLYTLICKLNATAHLKCHTLILNG